MADQKEMQLTLFLDSMAASLANDLEWALARLDEMKHHTPVSKEHAERYVYAQHHLRTRRAYEAACAKVTAHA